MEGRKPCDTEEDDYGDLLKWAASVGVTDAPLDSLASGLGHTVGIADFPGEGGRGLAALRDIEQGELILRIPHAVLLGVHCAKKDPPFAKLLEEFTYLSSVQILAVYLLTELAKSRDSRWYCYFLHLPKQHHTLAHFSQAEAQELQAEDVTWRREKTRRLWKEALPLLRRLGLERRYTSFKAWLWASATVDSRTLYVPWDKAGVLCPIGDLFNYEPPGIPWKGPPLGDFWRDLPDDLGCYELQQRIAAFLAEQDIIREATKEHDTRGHRGGGYEPSIGAYCFYARKRYKKNQQVLLCYGQYTNLELLEHYGFMLWENPNDAVHLSLPQPREFGFEDTLETCQKAAYYIQVDGTPSFSLLQALRLRASPSAVRKSLGYLAAQGLPISEEGDRRVYQWLATKCKEILQSLPTTAAEDMALLVKLEGKHPTKTCSCVPVPLSLDLQLDRLTLSICWRLSYKLILHLCLRMSSSKLLRKSEDI